MSTRTKEATRLDGQVRMPNVVVHRKQTAKEPSKRPVTFPSKKPTSFDLEPVERRELPAKLRATREAYACTKEIPGHDAPEFDLLTGSSSIRGLPSVDSMLPAYVLDSNYRIRDWNDAFALVFDRTMEGRRGMNVLEWTFFLDNFEEVLDHGARVFGEPHSLPAIDIETIRYTSRRYGQISAVKRAYRVPDDQGDCAGWLVCLEPDFADRANAKQFLMELVTTRQRNLMWSEYAMSYDMVLTKTTVYPELIDTILGERPPLTPIPPEARVLDLGAGTGNIAYRLAGPSKNRIIIAMDNNQMMLNLLREKCKAYMREDDGPGVLVLKQDITSLFGLKDEFCDFAILNNVLYALDDPVACLREVKRVLVPEGEIRISNPKKDANLDTLFRRIRKDLEMVNGRPVGQYYDHVARINYEQLAPLLRRFSSEDIQRMLREAGFSRSAVVPTDVYAKQSMLICAWK